MSPAPKELVARLRRKAKYGIGSGEFYNDILVEAADRIERLTAPVEGLETTAEKRAHHISFLFERMQPDGGDTFAFFDDLLLKCDRQSASIATLTARLAAAEAALAKLREKHPEPEGVVEEPPRDNAITDAW